MEITLSPELQHHAEQKVAAGQYPSVNEMLNSLLRKDFEQEAMFEDTDYTVAEIKRMMQESDARLERGEGIRVTREGLKDFFEDIIARGEQRFAMRDAGK